MSNKTDHPMPVRGDYIAHGDARVLVLCIDREDFQRWVDTQPEEIRQLINSWAPIPTGGLRFARVPLPDTSQDSIPARRHPLASEVPPDGAIEAMLWMQRLQSNPTVFAAALDKIVAELRHESRDEFSAAARIFAQGIGRLLEELDAPDPVKTLCANKLAGIGLDA